MSDEEKIVKFTPVSVGSGFRFEPDEILENAKDKNLKTVVVLSEFEDGKIWASGNANAGEMLIIIERAKRKLVFGEDP